VFPLFWNAGSCWLQMPREPLFPKYPSHWKRTLSNASSHLVKRNGIRQQFWGTQLVIEGFFFWFFIYLCGVFVSQFGWLHDHNFSAMIFLQSLDFVAGGAWCIICITNWCIDMDASSWDHSWVSVVACIFEQLLAVTRGHYLVFFILNCGNMLYW
jgi:hypothetical protein